jgi:hypothetical protein
VLSGRGLCDELITRPEESYRLCCVVAYDLENLKNEKAMTRIGSQRHCKKEICNCTGKVHLKTGNEGPEMERMYSSTLPSVSVLELGV